MRNWKFSFHTLAWRRLHVYPLMRNWKLLLPRHSYLIYQVSFNEELKVVLGWAKTRIYFAYPLMRNWKSIREIIAFAKLVKVSFNEELKEKATAVRVRLKALYPLMRNWKMKTVILLSTSSGEVSFNEELKVLLAENVVAHHSTCIL